MWFHEWYDTEEGNWCLEPAYELSTEDDSVYYRKEDLYKGGYLAEEATEIDPNELKEDGILPLRVGEENCPGVKGDLFRLTLSDRNFHIGRLENVWLPLPYFHKRTPKKFRFGPVNWVRMKLIPMQEEKGVKQYQILLAFDTRVQEQEDQYKECPVFPDKFQTTMEFGLCKHEFLQMDYCRTGETWSYIDEYLLNLVHPGVQRVAQLRQPNQPKMSYIASYLLLVNYLAQNDLLPLATLHRSDDVESKHVDMVVDIGNSRTTALLIEGNSNFNQVRLLELQDYSSCLDFEGEVPRLRKHTEPFDMRLAFRKVEFGGFGTKGSRQFVHPSFVRLGIEANELLHKACAQTAEEESLSTYSSPKRYLWDGKPNKEEWRYLLLPGEEGDTVLHLPGVSEQLRSDGLLDTEGLGGQSYHYSRRSLMTFSFLEMLVQARIQINSETHRSPQTGLGSPSMPRKVRRIIVTCPTAMSRVEREALIKCAKTAVRLLDNFDHGASPEDTKRPLSIEVIPASTHDKEGEQEWYYDEATCAQLVYMYGEVGHKYKGCCSEFFALYGKHLLGEEQPSITVGSLDIGAGTSDLMISRYTYKKGDVTTIKPDPQFYDSYYYAGDDMLYGLIKNVMLLDENSAFRQSLKDLGMREYRQKMKDFFGKDYNGQTQEDRRMRKDFNIQYSLPLMSHYLQLLNRGSEARTLGFDEVFADCPPNDLVLEGFMERTGIDVRNLRWHFDPEQVSEVVRKEFEPLLKKIATILYAHACDVVLLSGRPASLPPIRDLFLKYYSISPNRLIVLNDYYVGDWYPFGENTGHIRNAKTIVAMGGVIGHYASELSNLNKFVIDLEQLRKKLRSTANYVEASREGQPISYFITPDQHQGELLVTSLPLVLNVRQINLDSYPCRALYNVDFNHAKIGDRLKRRAVQMGEEMPTDAKLRGLVHDSIDTLRKRMPFTLSIERDANDQELLSLTAITDSTGKDVPLSDLEISIQSLGAEEQYWLDSGAFDF